MARTLSSRVEALEASNAEILSELRSIGASLKASPKVKASKVAEPKAQVNGFYEAVIAARIPCAMGRGGKPVAGCARHFAPNGAGAKHHLVHR